MSSLSSLAEEQFHLGVLYGRLDELRAQARNRLDEARRQGGGLPSWRSHRDAATQAYAERLARYDAVEPGLCFGRLHLRDGDSLHIGRIGLHDPDRALLVDWRAPAARPFYTATAITPQDVTLRRHIRTRDRTVVDLDDEILDLDTATDRSLVGEAALIAALTADRTGRMRDIVATIQAEQDAVIRSDAGGVLVVQGGPGTGKTAVALHRAAYLLYTHREQLAARGVLIVGPNATFLRYISQVLPSLAETGVLLATLGDLYPGTTARRAEPAEVAEIKGRATMPELLAGAVRDRQRIPETPLEIPVDGHVLRLTAADCVTPREQARASGLRHNPARPIFAAGVLTALAGQIADRIGDDPFWDDPLGGDDALAGPNVLDEDDLADIRADLAENPRVQAALDSLWPVLTAARLLTDLYASRPALLSAATDPPPVAAPVPVSEGPADGGGPVAGRLLSVAECAALWREPGGGWSPADVPLLDEAAELLGEDDRDARAAAAREQSRRLAYAQGVLDITAGSKSFELEDDDEAAIPNAADIMEADMLAERFQDRVHLSTAERAAADREWVFGHVIVDEAQELSPMAWRLLMRRCPSRSMTIVGDLAQAGSLGAPTTWSEVLTPYVADRWRLAELTVSYRTPAEIMSYAERLLATVDPTIVPPRPVRSTGVAPWEATGTLTDLAARVTADIDALAGGRLAVIAPAGHQAALAAALPALTTGPSPDLEDHAVLLTVAQAKGLEFDTVLVINPAEILTDSRRGSHDLYVALTRPTRNLGVFTLLPR
ncbi:helicase [Actinoplanes sp. SE50]|uniref:HelD family protein n=1 Tax=unclassified Actinoplanes TaxID=2626549 RepID=UPI00023ED12B|nr:MULTISPECIES: AAA family ATPase [unclassified Actinoplanes]AEV87270.1 Helicase IV [Actinoplanes sp. SE50/110]ATO85670.1 helicase [Actinoplanes sp. SE50]SLM03083.1 helicase [Actinoplanes sp. SE50/110]